MITTKTLSWPRAFTDLVVSTVVAYSPRLNLRSRRRRLAAEPAVLDEKTEALSPLTPTPTPAPTPQLLQITNIPADWDHARLAAVLPAGELSELFTIDSSESQTALLNTSTPCSVLSEKLATLQLLISAPTNTTPLLTAAVTSGNITALQLLLPISTAPTVSADGTTLLHLAASTNNTATLSALLSSTHSLNITTTTTRGWTPLHTAAHHGASAATTLLLAAGADTNTADTKSLTPLLLAARDGSHGTRVSQAGNAATIAALIAAGADANAAGDAGLTALHYAARNGHVEVVKLLLGKDVAVDAQDAEGRTPLFHAAKRGAETVVHALLEAGADKGVRNRAGWRAARVAELNGREEARGMLESGEGGRRCFYIYV
ncbi:ankyrin repeat-containing domain protein [Geopyxis carbonaria]|nr:ankyrin repeat-containing domain protein [Geopyxis carbonaria]